jgi:hypothetical protein
MKKHYSDNPAGTHQQHQGHGSSGQAAPARIFTPVKIGICLGVVLLGATALVTLLNQEPPAGAQITAPRAAAIPADSMAKAFGVSTTPAVPQPIPASNPPAAPGTKMAINSTDPFTGKVITPKSPTVDYKGYTIAFCCEQSSGWKGGWERLSEAEKDAILRKYLGN